MKDKDGGVAMTDEHLSGVGVSSDTPDQGQEQGLQPQRDQGPAYNAEPTQVSASSGDRLDPRAVPEAGGAAAAAGIQEGRGLSGAMWLVLAIVALIVIAVVVIGILSRAAKERRLEHVTVESSILTVSVVHPSSAPGASELSLPGSTQAYVDTPIYSRTNGYLKHWYFDIGAHVKKGQLMATIETPEVDEQLQVAQADLKSAQAILNLADITKERYQALLKSNSVSKQETDEAVGNELSKQAAVEASEANVRRLQQLQSFEKIYAPFSGIVTARNTDVGDLIVAGQEGSGFSSTGNGNGGSRELFHLASTGRLRVFVSVPEMDTTDIFDGEHATLTSDAYPGKVFDGVVARNANAVDPSTRTLNVEVDVPNTHDDLLPGAYVFVHFKLPVKGRYLTIPSDTLIFRAQGLQVGVVRGDRVQLIPVVVAHDDGASVEVSAGLSESDRIIVNPSDSLSNGQEVRVAEQGGTQENGAGR